jgi:hypothetical protein
LPLVQKSREAQIPSWLLLPAISCAIIGSIFSFSPISILNINKPTRTKGEAIWIGPMYIVASGKFMMMMVFHGSLSE